MKFTLKKLAAALVAAAMLMPTVAMAATTNDEGEIMIRVGLASSSKHNELGQLACAQLQNVDGYGEGFRFGMYDDYLNFVELGRSGDDVNHLSVMKTQNLCYGYDSDQVRYTYSANVDSDIRVGCYHIEIGEDYDSFDEADEVAGDYDGGFVAWIDGEYRVRVGSWFTKEEAELAMAELEEGKIVGTSSYGITAVETGTDDILFQYDDRNASRFAVMPDVTEADDVQSWFRGFKYRGGFTYERISGGNLTVVNVLPLEDYIKGVAPYEMGRDWHLEALKVQATCARTYVLANLGKHESLGFDVCNSSWCQVYQGCGSARKDYGPTAVSDRAVDQSAGQVVWYKDKLAETYYSSSHGGASESIYHVWGSKLSTYPYLCGVIDPYEQKVDNINAKSSWTVSYTENTLATRLHSYGYGVGSRIDCLELTYSELGNVIKLVVHWSNGQKNTFKPDSIRSYFGLSSIRFTVNGVTVEGSAPQPEPDEDKTQAAAGEFLLNEEDILRLDEDFSEGIYVITGEGETELIDSNPYVITGSGSKSELLEPVEEEEEEEDVPAGSAAGTVTVSGSKYVFNGSGWGHQLGMSQYGAYAMAKSGFEFEEIIEFYFPGTVVGDYED